MKRSSALALAAVTLAACTKDSTSQPFVGATPAPAAKPATAPPASAPPSGPPWRSELCRPAARSDATARPEALTFSGECVFAQLEPAWCHPQEDDFYVLVRRPLAGGQMFIFYVNVERYHGPGDYPGLGQIHVEVRDGQSLYRWSNSQGTMSLAGATAGGPPTRATFHGVRLSAEPGTLASGSIVVNGAADCVDSILPPF